MPRCPARVRTPRSRETSHVFRAVRHRDVLAPESDRWQELVARFADRARRFGYGLVLTPIFEHAEVFHRVGESTDVVSKEMYEFEDRGGRRLALRPEGTASVVRAFVQNHPPVPWKCWYLAPNFRAERPQKGRYRQHYQVGAEVLGVDDPDVDVEVIAALRLPPRSRADADPPAAQLDGRRRQPGPAPRGAARLPPQPRRSPRRRARARRAQPVAHPRLEAARLAAAARRARRSSATTSATETAEHFERVQAA